MYSASGEIHRKRRIRWWQIPFLPITFPLSLVVVAIGAVFPWLRGLRLWKVALGFMVVWIIWGQAMVMFDPRSGNGPDRPFYSSIKAKTWFEITPYQEGWVYLNPSWVCDPTDHMVTNFGGWPLGKPMVLALSCTSLFGREMLTRAGFPDEGEWVVRQYELTMADYYVDGRISSSFLYLGLIAMAEIVLLIPWLAVWLALTIVRHVHIDWR